MDTRKYSSPLGGDTSLNKATKGRDWKGLKGQAALALAVSLWIGSAGVAWAEEVTVLNGESREYIDCSGDGNTITVESGGKVTGSSGGAGITGGVNNNQITMAGTVENRINGGYSSDGEVTENQVTISGSVNDCVYGGNATNGYAAKDNHVTLLAGGTVTYYIYGGEGSGDAEKNTVTIKGGEVEYVYGAKSTGGDVLENEVYIQGGTVKYNVYGGFTNGNEKKARGNVVVISDGTVNAVYGGVSTEDQATNNKVTISGGEVGENVYGGWSKYMNSDEIAASTTNEVTISGGEVKGKVYGGYSDSGLATNNTVTITGGTVGAKFKKVYGGEGKTGASGNKVTISGGTINGGVSGGESSNGHAVGNEVHIQDVTIGGQVYGGYTSSSDATGNKVILTSSEVKGTVYGGCSNGSGKATGNTIKMTDSKVTGTYVGVYGGNGSGDYTTGNTLHLSGANEVKGDVANFEAIKLMDTLAWNTTKPVLSAGSFENYGTFDITAATALANRTASGTMTLLSSDTDNNFNTLNLTYKNGTTSSTVTLDDTKTSQVVKTGANESSTVDGVTLGYNNTHTVKLEDVGGNTKNAVTYNVTNNVNKITLGTISWETLGTVRDGKDYDFSALTVSGLDTSALKLTFADDAKYKGMSIGMQMKLISNATGLQSFSKSGINVVADHTVANGAKLEAKVNTRVFTQPSDKKVVLQTNDVWVEKVDLSGWDSSKDAFEIPNGWERPVASNGDRKSVSVKAEGFTAPTIAAGGQKVILTAPVDFFNDNYITGALKYKECASSSDTVSGVTLTGSESKGVKASYNGNSLIYARSKFNVKDISLGAMSWNDGRTAGTSYDFTNTATIDATKLAFTFTDDQKGALSSSSNMTLLSEATNLAADKAVTKADHTQTIDYAAANGTTLSGTLAGTVSTVAEKVNYDATGMTLNSVDITGWDGTTAAVPTGWTTALGNNSITASNFSPNVAAGTTKDILTATTNDFFAENQIAEAIKYKALASSSDTANGVTLTGSESKGVKTADNGTKLVYERSNFNINNIAFGTMAWGMPRGASAAGYDYSNAAVNMDGLTFSNPADIAANSSTTLLTANNTLDAITEKTKDISYGYSPVGGVTVSGIIKGNYKTESNAIKYTATANKATKLTFGNVEWKDTGALMTRPNNITFAGADVDTTNINFTNIKELEANKNMTLVSDFGGSVGTITGTKYKVGSTLQGEGKASLVDSNDDGTMDALIFTTDTRAEKMTVQEQTHNTVMGAEVGMAALSAGNDFVGAATEGLAMAGNTGTDGMATYANMGGGSMNVETGSHVKTHTWNAILALGHKNEKKLSTTEYGAFFEYGTGNYSTFNGAERGDGSTHYTGGGILGKWQKNNGFYVEGSLRAGSIHDDATNVLRDVNGNPYSYDTDATYWGAHIGVGREIKLNKTDILDLYAKYFYNHRGSVSFDAGGHYDLDAVESSVLRIGTRYTVKKNDKVNFYGGLALEHEFCGRAAGTADGVAIRGADISGTSVRGEIGATFQPGDNSPVTLDLNLSGFAGKKRGLTGGLSAVFHF